MKTRAILLGLAIAAVAGGVAWQQGLLRLPGAPAPTEAGSPPPGPPGPGGPGGPGGLGGPGGRRGLAASGAADGPTPVVVTPVGREDVAVTVDGIGTVQAFAAVTVKAQVEGRILEIGFREGEEVAAGAVLVRIDAASYKAIHDQAVARREQDEAELRNARMDLDRYNRLAQSESGSRQQADTQRAVVAKLEAQLKIDQGVIDAAKVDLDNTTIRAPIPGRTGIRAVEVGTLVRASDTTGIVSIAQIHPIAVTFTVPQQQLGALLAAQARGEVPVEVLGGEGRAVIDRGRVEVIDNQVDSTTGTVKVKASLPNAATRLWPGQFVDVRVLVDTLREALTVPTAAVQRGTEGSFLWVLGAEDKVTRRAVAVVRQDETRAVIGSGVALGETVITTGFTRLTEGAKVKPSAPVGAKAAADPDPASAPAVPGSTAVPGERRGGGQGGGEGRRQRPAGEAAGAAGAGTGARP